MKKRSDDLKTEPRLAFEEIFDDSSSEPNKKTLYRLPEILAMLMADGFVVESMSDDGTKFVLKKGLPD